MAKIRTNKKVYQSRNGELCYISREMINFNQDKVKNEFISIVKEEAFIEEQVELFDDLGNPTGEFETIITIVEHKGTRAHKIVSSQVNLLFQMIGSDIVSSVSFTDQFEQLQATALLLDTQPHRLYNTDPEDWDIY